MINLTSTLKSVKLQIATTRRLLPLVWHPAPGLFLASLLLNLLAGLAPLVSMWASAAIFGVLAEGMHKDTPFEVMRGDLVYYLVVLAGIAVLATALGLLTNVVQKLYQVRVANYIQKLIVRKTTTLDLACFENPEFHNKLHHASTEATTRPVQIVQTLMGMASSLTTLLSLGVVIFLWHAWLVPVIMVAPLIAFYVSAQMASANVEMRKKRAETARRAGYLRGIMTGEPAAKEIRLLGLGEFLIERLTGAWKEMYDQDLRFMRRKMMRRGGLGMLAALNEPAIFAYAAVQLLQKHISFGQFTLYGQSIFALQGRLGALAGGMSQLVEHNLFVASLFELLEMQPQVEAPRAPVKLPEHRAPRIEFRNVSFKYATSSKLILDNVSFVLNPGEILALIGNNGAGKTTIIKLLSGLYEPTEGAILVEEIDMRMIPRDTLRNLLGVVLQDFNIYNLSIYDNIAMGKINLVGETEKISEAAESTGLSPIVAEMPDGYDTLLARSFKKGHELSGGQRQLVALTRSVLRKPGVLILDEPSAALDVHNEKRFFSIALGSNRPKGQSVLLISHRMTGVAQADRIIVLEQGKIVEHGSHVELMAQGGRYATLLNERLKMYDSWVGADRQEAPAAG